LKDIRKLGLEELKTIVSELGEKPFRAKQIYEWIWQKSAVSFDQMTNLSVKTRELLKDSLTFNPITVKDKQKSADGTIKYAFQLFDGHVVEGVLIPTDTRITACVSSQVGCSLTCKFCATGYMKRERNLDAAEIYDQVVHIMRDSEELFGRPLTNIVYMGMGEPLLNYKNMLFSTQLISSDKGLNFSNKRITVSTAGIAKMIDKLAEDQVKFNLALSLHAANDLKRNQIMPINEGNSLDALAASLNNFCRVTKQKVTFEYIVFAGFNDDIVDADELIKFSSRVPCKINIIEYNPIEFADFQNASEDKLDLFLNHLEKKGLNVNVRRSRGKDIDAACGQLAIKN